MVGHSLMIEDDVGLYALVKPGNEGTVDEVEHHDVLLATTCLNASPVARSGKKIIYHKGWIDFNKNGIKDLYEDPAQPIDLRVEDLLKQMTLDEKIAELNLLPYYESQDSIVRSRIRLNQVGALLKANGAALNRSLQTEAVEKRRLGTPIMFHEDVIHGYRTILPIPLGESCCWDREMVRQGAALAAREAAAAGIQLTYAPMVDVSNDSRWGRIMETYQGAQGYRQAGRDHPLQRPSARARRGAPVQRRPARSVASGYHGWKSHRPAAEWSGESLG